MLDKNTLIVLAYIKNHFSKTDEYLERIDLLSTGLSDKDINKSIDILENNAYINVNHKYISAPIEEINL